MHGQNHIKFVQLYCLKYYCPPLLLDLQGYTQCPRMYHASGKCI